MASHDALEPINMLAKIWNGRAAGLPMAAILAIGIMVNGLRDAWSSVLWRANLGGAGRCARVQAGVTIRYPARIILGSRTAIGRGTEFESEFADAECRIGTDSQINRGALLDFSGSLHIGDRVVVSEHAVVYTHSHGNDPKSKPMKTPLVIEDDVWIGANARIMEGVGRIGRGALVASCAVVTKEVPAGTIVAGVPARVIGQRAPKDVVQL